MALYEDWKGWYRGDYAELEVMPIDGVEDFKSIKEFSPEANFFQKFDRVLSSDMRIMLKDSKISGLGCSDLKRNSIFISFGNLRDDSDSYYEMIRAAKGINNHELAHLLFTSRKNGDYFGSDALFRLFNMIEDGRVENFFIIDYPSSKGYFVNLTLKYVIGNIKKHKAWKLEESQRRRSFVTLALSYITIYGRKFLSPEIASKMRDEIKKEMDSESPEIVPLKFDIAKAERLIDDYILTSGFKQQETIVRELFGVVAPLFYDRTIPENVISSRSGRAARDSKKAEKRNIEKSKQLKDYLKNKDKKDKKDTKGEKEDIDSSGDNSISEDLISKEIEKSVSDTKDDTDEAVIRIMGSRGVSIRDINFGSGSAPYIIQEGDRLMSQRLQALIRKLRNDLSQQYVRKLKSGNLDIRRAVHAYGQPRIDVFKKFRHNKIGKTRVGAAILVDSSGSMKDSDYDIALRSAYCLGDCLEKTGSKCMILEFSSSFSVIKKFNKPVNSIKTERAYGSTVPEPALIFSEMELKKIAEQEGIKNLLLFMVTDCFFSKSSLTGEGCDGNSMKDIFNRIKGKIETVVIQVSERYSCLNYSSESAIKGLASHYCRLDDFSQLLPKVSEFIRKYEVKIHRKAKMNGGVHL